MIRGPKTTLTLHRYTSTSDGGGSSSKAWASVAKISGVLTFIWADERVSADRERVENRYQFWMEFRKGLNITTKDEFSKIGVAQRYRIIYVDNILEQDKLLKIDLVQTR